MFILFWMQLHECNLSLPLSRKFISLLTPIVTAFLKLFPIAFADLSFIGRNCTICSKRVQEKWKEDLNKYGEADILKTHISLLSVAVFQGWCFSVPLTIIIYYLESMLYC